MLAANIGGTRRKSVAVMAFTAATSNKATEFPHMHHELIRMRLWARTLMLAANAGHSSALTPASSTLTTLPVFRAS